jgi:formylglycine-generating enzyme required for sulfatase activity
VVCISWDDTQAYIQWLNNQVNTKALGKYRLPSEAEWEYAARGGESKQAYPWGNKASHNQANYGKDTCCDPAKSGKDKWDYTAPVARFPANDYGLHDMHGNVWEWVQDKYQNNYKKAPKDGSAWESAGAARVFRGGSSWYGAPRYLRSAYRNRNAPDYRYGDLGFRLARSPVK